MQPHLHADLASIGLSVRYVQEKFGFLAVEVESKAPSLATFRSHSPPLSCNSGSGRHKPELLGYFEDTLSTRYIYTISTSRIYSSGGCGRVWRTAILTKFAALCRPVLTDSYERLKPARQAAAAGCGALSSRAFWRRTTGGLPA